LFCGVDVMMIWWMWWWCLTDLSWSVVIFRSY